MIKYLYIFIIIYFIVSIISQIYSFIIVPNRLHWLYERKYPIFHLISPISVHKINYGHYTLLFNLIPYEIYIKKNLRNKTYGMTLSEYLINNYYISVSNKNIFNMLINKNILKKVISLYNNNFFSFYKTNNNFLIIIFNFKYFYLGIKLFTL